MIKSIMWGSASLFIEHNILQRRAGVSPPLGFQTNWEGKDETKGPPPLNCISCFLLGGGKERRGRKMGVFSAIWKAGVRTPVLAKVGLQWGIYFFICGEGVPFFASWQRGLRD